MESSPGVSVAAIDPYVLEFAVNFKWLLRYASQSLDPTVEVHYPTFVADVAHMESVMARVSFEQSCTLNDMPFGALRLSREGMLYLLVCDHLLGGCPPTMHPFLRRAYGGSRESSRRSFVSEKRQTAGQIASTAPVTRAGGPAANADLNVSFPSVSDGEDNEGENYEGGNAEARSPSARALDGKALGTLDGEEPTVDSLTLESKEAQAALLLLRWLFAECVLSEDELAATLNLDRATPEGVSHTTTRDSEELPVFRRHQRLACRFARLIPFYLGAHVLISRSLLLQYSATLLMVSDVTQHVRRLEAPLQSNPNYLPYSALHPPSSVEGSLLEWFQAILDSTQKQLREGSAAVAPLASCSALRGFIEHGPFNRDVLDPSERVFFRLVQSGECVCVALWFYCPAALPLAALSRALHDAEAFMAAPPAGATLCSPEESTQLFQRHQSRCYWTAIFAASRYLGVTPLLSVDEVVAFGRSALPLHLFVFVQQLFAVLATTAEEEVRVSADTAWWEQLGNSDGYTELMEMKEATRQSARNAADSSTAAMPGAQQILRQSMRDSFPPDVFHKTKAAGTAPEKADREEEEVVATGSSNAWAKVSPESRSTLTSGKTCKGDAQMDRRTKGVGDAPCTEEHLNAGDAAASRAAESGDHHCAAVAGPVKCDGNRESSITTTASSAATPRPFPVDLAYTQHGDDGEASLHTSGMGSGAVETATLVLRPMVQRRTAGSHVATVDMPSYSGTTFTSVDSLEKVSTEDCGRSKKGRGTAERQVEFAARAVDTYAYTPDEDVSLFTDAAVPSSHQRNQADLDSPQTAAAIQPVHFTKPDSTPASSAHGDDSIAKAGTHASRAGAKPSSVLARLNRGEQLLRLVEPLELEDEQHQEQPSSPQLPGPRRDAAKKRAAAFDEAQRAGTPLSAVLQSSVSSALTYSTDFVVLSGPQNASEHPAAEVAVVVVDSSTSLPSNSPLQPPPLEDEVENEPVVSVSPVMPPETTERADEIEPPSLVNKSEADKATTPPLSNSAVAVKTFNSVESDSSSNAGRAEAVALPSKTTDDKKESGASSPSRLSSPPVTPAASSAALSPHKATPQRRSSSEPSLSSSSPQNAAGSPRRSSARTGGSPLEVSGAAAQLDVLPATTAPTPPITASVALTMQSTVANSSHMHSVAKETPAPFSHSVTDIAVEDDDTSCASQLYRADASGQRESIDTPTERENVNRERAAAAAATAAATAAAARSTTEDDTSKETPPPLQRSNLAAAYLPSMNSSATPRVAFPLPNVLSPSPLQPDREPASIPPLGPHGALLTYDDSPRFHRTISEGSGSNMDGLSPLTPVLTQSISEVFGSDYASLLEDAASSCLSPRFRRRPRHWEEESWFSSASHPHWQSSQSAAGSLGSVGPVRHSMHVQELLSQLRGMTLEDLETRNKDELRDALARQQELVQQLTSALRERTRSQASGIRALVPSSRPSERKWQPHSNSRSLQAMSRQRSVSGMTVESQAPPSHSVQTDLAAQLAETDMSSLLTDFLLPAESVSPTRAKPK